MAFQKLLGNFLISWYLIMLIPLLFSYLLCLLVGILVIITFLYFLINLCTCEIFTNIYVIFLFFVLTFLNLFMITVIFFIWGIYNCLDKQIISLEPHEISETEKYLNNAGFLMIFMNSVFLLLTVLILWFARDEIRKRIFTEDQINITTFAEKMNLNMNLVSGTYFKKDDTNQRAENVEEI